MRARRPAAVAARATNGNSAMTVSPRRVPTVTVDLAASRVREAVPSAYTADTRSFRRLGQNPIFTEAKPTLGANRKP